MTIVLDTSLLVAFLHANDPNHAAAQRIVTRVLAGKHGAAVANEQVLSEGLTLLRRRPGREDVSQTFAAMFLGRGAMKPFVRLFHQDLESAKASVSIHFERYDRGLSFTDCSLVVLAKDLDAPIASFDAHFDGLVERIAA